MSESKTFKLYNGNCLDVLRKCPDNYFDSLVTDPPAGISFMGKEWDGDKGGRNQWIAWMAEIMVECERVLKPGAHGLVWALPRTSHWTATALEDAGFEVRDVVAHLFGTGFPKSMNLGNGWGTALKPASEHYILVRKPCSEKTVAVNVLKWGCGGINIDASRVGFQSDSDKASAKPQGAATSKQPKDGLAKAAGIDSERIDFEVNQSPLGRFPANLILSHSPGCVETVAAWECTDGCPVKELDEQSGILSAGHAPKKSKGSPFGGINESPREEIHFGKGGASRFFYVAKASKSDKGEGNTHPTVKSTTLMTYLIKLVTPEGGMVLDPFMGSGSTGVSATRNGFAFRGIELSEEYFKISEARLEDAHKEKEAKD